MNAEQISQAEIAANESLETQETDVIDPTVFLDGYHSSSECVEAYKSRLHDLPAYKKHGDNMPDDLKKLVINEFRKTEKYKQGLWIYLEKHPLKFDETKYSKEFLEKLKSYWQLIKEMDKISREKNIDSDRERSSMHTRAAEQLVEDGVAPSATIGRLIVHFLSIDQSYDVQDPARDEKRLAAEASYQRG